MRPNSSPPSESPGHRASRDLQVPKGLRDRLVLLDLKEQLAQLVHRERRVRLELLVLKARKALLERLVARGRKETPALKVLRATLARKVRRVTSRPAGRLGASS